MIYRDRYVSETFNERSRMGPGQNRFISTGRKRTIYMDRFVRLFLVVFLFAIVLSIPGCDGGSPGSGGTTQNPTTPMVTVAPASSSITTAQSLSVTIAVSGSSGTPTGSIVLSSGSYTSPSTALSSGSAPIPIAAGSPPTGSDTLTAAYTPDSASSSTYNSAAGTSSVTVTAPALVTPTVT